VTVGLADRVIAELRTVAPELDAASVDRDAVLLDSLDLDSMDFLDFVTALGARFGIDIPEADYPRVRTIHDCVRYLEARGVAHEP
jgi:acyl carrier protein